MILRAWVGGFFCNINNSHFENSPPVFQLGYVQKINAIPYMFCDACTDCYILYRVRQYLIAFLGISIFVGCVAVGAVFADLCNKKRNSQKKSNCFSSILSYRGYNPNHSHKLQKSRCVAERFSDTAAFSFLAAAYRIRPSPPLRTQTATGSMMPPQSEARSPGSSST